jgi:hypothetical protein
MKNNEFVNKIYFIVFTAIFSCSFSPLQAPWVGSCCNKTEASTHESSPSTQSPIRAFLHSQSNNYQHILACVPALTCPNDILTNTSHPVL